MTKPIVCPQCNSVLSKSEEQNHLRCGNCGFYCNKVVVEYIHTKKQHDEAKRLQHK